MSTLTQDQLREIYNSLPEDLQDAMGSAETSATVRKIAKNYGLSVDQMGELAGEIGLTILGVHLLNEMPKNIALALGCDLTLGNAIYRDINGSIFLKVRASLERVHDLRGANPLITYSNKSPKVEPVEEVETENEEVGLAAASPTSSAAQSSVKEVNPAPTPPATPKREPAPPQPDSPPHKAELDPYREAPQ